MKPNRISHNILDTSFFQHHEPAARHVENWQVLHCERSSLARIAPCTAALFHCFIRVVGPMGSLGIEAFRTLICTKSIAFLRSMPLRCSTLSPPSRCLQSRQRVRHQADGLVRLFVVGELWIMDCDWNRSSFLHTPGHACASARLASRHATSSL